MLQFEPPVSWRNGASFETRLRRFSGRGLGANHRRREGDLSRLLKRRWNTARAVAFSSTRTRDASGGHHVWLGDHLLIIALIAGALGFGVVAGTAFAAAKII